MAQKHERTIAFIVYDKPKLYLVSQIVLYFWISLRRKYSTVQRTKKPFHYGNGIQRSLYELGN